MWPQYHHCFPEQQTAQIHQTKLTNYGFCQLNTAKEILQWISKLMNKVTSLQRGDVIFCKKQLFVITEEGYIDHYTSGAMVTYFKPQILSLRQLLLTGNKKPLKGRLHYKSH